jgi:outer membrane lipoprotein-sorting protein
MRALYLLALTPFAVLAFSPSDPAIDAHVAALQKAATMQATFSMTQVGGSSDEGTLTMVKPNKFKFDNPALTIVGDGTTVYIYDKGGKVYQKLASSDESIAKAFSSEALIAYSAFFNPKFADMVKDVKKGNVRKVRGVDVTDYTVTLKDDRVVTLAINNANGVAWGSRYTVKNGGDMIVLAKDIQLGDQSVPDATFAWTPPADARDLAEGPKVDPNAPKYADIKSIFDSNCVGCHSGDRPKGGVDLSSFENIMASRAVAPGDADHSRLIKVIRSGKMPPAGPLANGDVDKLAAWVNGGAQK